MAVLTAIHAKDADTAISKATYCFDKHTSIAVNENTQSN